MAKSKQKKPVPITKSSINKTRPLNGAALIRKFHSLQSQLQAAKATKQDDKIAEIESAIVEIGGLESYQKESLKGQDKRKGGDASRQLVEWMKEDQSLLQAPKVKVLEIGSLSPDNHLSRYNAFNVTRIDLNAQHHAILQQDFLDRPAPVDQDDLFDGISLSLVLNFVPVAKRSDFLLHLCKFLPYASDHVRFLFFTLPAQCIQNSRYMNKTILLSMLGSLGFTVMREKITDKIAYWLLKRVSEIQDNPTHKRREIRPGKDRNNFWIPLQTNQ